MMRGASVGDDRSGTTHVAWIDDRHVLPDGVVVDHAGSRTGTYIPDSEADFLRLLGQTFLADPMAQRALAAKSPPDGNRMSLSVSETAVRLGLSDSTVYRRISAGRLPHVRDGRRILIPIAALEDNLEGRTVAASAPRAPARRRSTARPATGGRCNRRLGGL